MTFEEFMRHASDAAYMGNEDLRRGYAREVFDALDKLRAEREKLINERRQLRARLVECRPWVGVCPYPNTPGFTEMMAIRGLCDDTLAEVTREELEADDEPLFVEVAAPTIRARARVRSVDRSIAYESAAFDREIDHHKRVVLMLEAKCKEATRERDEARGDAERIRQKAIVAQSERDHARVEFKMLQYRLEAAGKIISENGCD